MPNLRQAMMAAAGAGGVGYLAYGWGGNPNGVLGVGIDDVKYSSPIQILEDNWLFLTSGNASAAGLKKNGTLWTWGRGAYGQQGHDDLIFRSAPTQVGSKTDWAKVGHSKHGVQIINTSGELWNTGAGVFGSIGDGTVINRSSPVQIGSLTDWSEVFQGGNSWATLALKTDGTLWAWGYNYAGQFGNETTVATSSPVQIATGITSACFGYGHSHHIKTDGTLWSVGENNSGQLGIEGVLTTDYSSPLQVGSLTNWSKVYSTTHMSLAIKTDGTLWGWGRNSVGYIGDGTVINRSSPVQIGSLTNWSKVASRPAGGTAVKTDGTIWTWGENVSGELGDGTVINKSSPIQVGSETDWGVPASATNTTWGIKSS